MMISSIRHHECGRRHYVVAALKMDDTSLVLATHLAGRPEEGLNCVEIVENAVLRRSVRRNSVCTL